jgi:hypothetical protein
LLSEHARVPPAVFSCNHRVVRVYYPSGKMPTKTYWVQNYYHMHTSRKKNVLRVRLLSLVSLHCTLTSGPTWI